MLNSKKSKGGIKWANFVKEILLRRRELNKQ